jgi:hypothetical protein
VSPAAFSAFRLSTTIRPDEGTSGQMLVTAGQSIPLTVTAQDAFGNAAADYAGTVAFSSTDANAGLPANYAFTSADAGVHTFAVDLKTATPNGVVWAFSVVDTANAATLAMLSNFEVTNAAAARFILNVPSNITAGIPFSVKVSVVDAYDNRAKNYFGTIQFANTAGPLGLPGNYTFTSNDAGDHAFTVTLNTTGSQTLTISDLTDNGLSTMVAVDVRTSGGGSGGSGGGGGGKNA